MVSKNVPRITPRPVPGPSHLFISPSWGGWVDGWVYRRAKQHISPVLPRNQHAPMNRNSAHTAFDHSSAWKNFDVRSVAEFYKRISIIITREKERARGSVP